MIVIRPIQLPDLDALLSLATEAGYGLTTLPHDRELLRKRILKSERSFRDMGDCPAGEAFLFVAEDLESHRVVGTSGIVSKVGGFQPFYAYRLETSIHQSEILGVHKEIQTLHLVAEHNGPSEIGSMAPSSCTVSVLKSSFLRFFLSASMVPVLRLAGGTGPYLVPPRRRMDKDFRVISMA